MGLAVVASRLSVSWVFTAIALTTATSLLIPIEVAAATKANIEKAAKAPAKPAQSSAKKGPPRGGSAKASKTGKAKVASKRGSADDQAVAVKTTTKAKTAQAKSASSTKAAKAGNGGKKRVAVAKSTRGKARKGRLAARPAQRSRAVAKALRRMPDWYMANTDDDEVLAIAARHLGTPYRFGSSGGGSFDCSGFVRTVYSEIGLDLPHSAQAQFSMGSRVEADELIPGDLVFFRTYRRGASHVGIYVGDGLFIHAAYRGGEVRLDSLEQNYFRTRYLGARRLRGIDS